MQGLSKGERLDHYEILEPLGEGGMGTVYKAIDKRLNRVVAIKFAKTNFSDRFQREAQAIAQLKHPHICVLYDVGPNYLVMEYLEGAPLPRKIPLKKSLTYGAEIAEALHAAHQHGIVHRDLKPSNILLTSQGVKLLDFGLAKFSDAKGTDDTVTNSLTAEGTVLGTFYYMSPEQLEGKPVDARSDLFALGCVLYEMITGAKAFDGKNTSSVVAAILAKEPPPIRNHQPFTPPSLERLIERCLAKDPEERWHCARDIALQLRTINPDEALQSTSRRPSWIWAAAAFAVLLLAGAAVWTLRRPAPANPVLQTTLLAPSGTELTGFGSAISPDGKHIVMTAETEGRGRALWLRSTDARTSRELPGTEDASFPFWSPDSKSIGFFAENYLKRLDLATGEIHRLARASNGRGGTWSESGTILYSATLSGALLQIPAGGGSATWATQLDRSGGETRHNLPQFLPDGQHFITLVRNADPKKTGTYLGRLGDPSSLRPVDGLTGSRYQSVLLEGPDGTLHALYVREDSLFVQPFDAKAGKLTGTPKLLPFQGAPSAVTPGFLNITASRTGLLLEGGSQREQSQLLWRDRSGNLLSVVGEGYEFLTPALSRDGKHIAVSRWDKAGDSNIWLIESGQSVLSPFTFNKSLNFYPLWSANGQEVFYSSDTSGMPNIYRKPANGTGQAKQLMPGALNQYAYDVSEDGRYLLYSEVPTANSFDLHFLALDGSGKWPFLTSPAAEVHGQFSPGSPPRYVAYASDESGSVQVYVRRFSLTGPGEERWQVSTEGGLCPRWRRDGKELFYITRDGRMMAVNCTITGNSISFDKPRLLFGGRARVPASVLGRFSYSVSADGQRFLTLGSSAPPSASSMELIVNWQSLLRN
jgi:eukaryotic-like serine/threonine-protein kinase